MTDTQPRQPPVGPIARLTRWLQLKNYQYEVTFSLYMLTTTEKIVFNTILFILVSMLLTAAYLYLPNHLYTIYKRLMYYISGEFVHLGHSEGVGASHTLSSFLKATKEMAISQTASSVIHDATARAKETIEVLKDEL